MEPDPLQLIAEGHAFYRDGHYEAAAAAFKAARDALASAGLRADADLVASHGHCLLALGRHDEARVAYLSALALAEGEAGGGDPAAALTGLGYLAQQQGDPVEATRRFAAALTLALARGDRDAAMCARQALGGAHYLAGDLRAARDAWSLALDDARALDADAERLQLLVNLGGVAYGLQQAHDAAVLLDEAAELLPAAWAGTLFEARLCGNRGLAHLALGRFDTALAGLESARAGYRDHGVADREAHVLATLSNLWRYRGDLGRAIALHGEVMALEAAHGFTVDEPGGLLYAAIEDHALHLDVAAEGARQVAAGGRQLPEADLSATVAAHTAHRPELGQRPFVIFAPPCPGLRGPLFPRGAAAVASYLNHHGVPTVVVPLSHYVDVYLGAETSRARIGEVVRDAIDSLRPRAVGITATFSFLYPTALDIARAARAAAPATPIVIGGPHVTYQDRECLAEAPEIDVVVRGEGEWTALELMRTLAGGGDLASVAGITWRAPDGALHRNRARPLGDVLALPEVDFDLMPRDFARRMEVSGITSRGCSFRCTYCHEFRFWGGVVRQHPVARVVGELERLATGYGNAMNGIDDSMLSMHEPYFVDLCDALARSRHLPPQFGLLTRVDTITAEGLTAMRRAGLTGIAVGLESGSPKVLEAMNKGVTVAQAEAGLALAHAHGIGVSGFFIVGHPGDDAAESERTLSWVRALLARGHIAYVDAAMFAPYPGTPAFIHPERYGVEILTRDWSRWRRTNRPVAQLADYPGSAIYLGYLRMLEAMAQARAPRDEVPKDGSSKARP